MNRTPLHGYNTNYRRSGEVFHIQTEDLGDPITAIVTQVFTGGTILAKKRSEYHDLLKSKNFEELLRERMQKQHKSVLMALRDGTLDMAYKGPVEKPERDTMRDTVQMTLPPEFYEELEGSDDSVVIEDFPPGEKPPSTPNRPPPPPSQVPVPVPGPPQSAPQPTLRLTPPPVRALGSKPPPVPTDSKSQSKKSKSPPSPAPDKGKKKKTSKTSQLPSMAGLEEGGDKPQRPRIFAEISRPARAIGADQLGERSLDEVILSYLAEDLQDD